MTSFWLTSADFWPMVSWTLSVAVDAVTPPVRACQVSVPPSDWTICRNGPNITLPSEVKGRSSDSRELLNMRECCPLARSQSIFMGPLAACVIWMPKCLACIAAGIVVRSTPHRRGRGVRGERLHRLVQRGQSRRGK